MAVGPIYETIPELIEHFRKDAHLPGYWLCRLQEIEELCKSEGPMHTAGPDLYKALLGVLQAQCYWASGMRVSEDSLLIEPLAMDPAFRQAFLALRKAKGL